MNAVPQKNVTKKIAKKTNHWLNVFKVWEGLYLLSETEKGIANMGFNQGKSTIGPVSAVVAPSDDSFILHANKA
jgi:hypothetical protein